MWFMPKLYEFAFCEFESRHFVIDFCSKFSEGMPHRCDLVWHWFQPISPFQTPICGIWIWFKFGTSFQSLFNGKGPFSPRGLQMRCGVYQLTACDVRRHSECISTLYIITVSAWNVDLRSTYGCDTWTALLLFDNFKSWGKLPHFESWWQKQNSKIQFKITRQVRRRRCSETEILINWNLQKSHNELTHNNKDIA